MRRDGRDGDMSISDLGLRIADLKNKESGVRIQNLEEKQSKPSSLQLLATDYWIL
jgi:hypothetical protein